MREYWTQKEENYLINNCNNKSKDDISKYLNKTKKQISRKLYNLNKNSNIKYTFSWTKEEDQILINNFHDKDINDYLYLLPRRTIEGCENRAYKLKLTKLRKEKKLKYTINHNFFSNKINLASYWAGFIAADGHIDNNINRCTIKLSFKDINHLEILKKQLNYNGIIRVFKSNSFNKILKYCNLDIYSKTIKTDLINNYKIIYKKTFLLQPPDLDFSNSMSYIAGLIDGDGTICINKYNKKSITIAGTKNICEWSKSILNNLINVENINIIKTGNIYVFKITGDRCNIIKNEINKYNLPILERKWNKL